MWLHYLKYDFGISNDKRTLDVKIKDDIVDQCKLVLNS